VYLELSHEWLAWDPFDGATRPAEYGADEPLVDRLAAVGRPMSAPKLAKRVLELAQEYGPLGWCSSCLGLHRLEWRMQTPGRLRRGAKQREWLGDWTQVAHHVNALRRHFAALQEGRGAPSDWQILWPTRDPKKLPLGDVAWERRMVAGHLSTWLASCHVGSSVTWDGPRPDRLETAGSLLGDLGARLVDELLEGARYRTCTGSVGGKPCRVTEAIQRDRERSGPVLCAACDAVRRKALTRQPKGGES
jgi:hypothetical protein